MEEDEKINMEEDEEKERLEDRELSPKSYLSSI
jgi:hypothetical protein